MMEPSRETLVQLLELQKIDATIDRLEARRRNLPEQARLDALQERMVALEKSVAEQQAVVDEVAGRQHKLDGEIEMLSAKIASEEQKLYSGAVASARELAAFQAEIESLKRRRTNVEDADLEIMEESEEAQKKLEGLKEEEAELRAAVAEAAADKDRASSELEEQLRGANEERGTWVPRFDPELLRFYDDLRVARGGVAIAALSDGACQGCHMRLPAQEYERVRHAEGLIYCDECRRILVVV